MGTGEKMCVRDGKSEDEEQRRPGGMAISEDMCVCAFGVQVVHDADRSYTWPMMRGDSVSCAAALRDDSGEQIELNRLIIWCGPLTQLIFLVNYISISFLLKNSIKWSVVYILHSVLNH